MSQAKLPFVTQGQQLLLWPSAIIGVDVTAWLFSESESPLAAVAVAAASVFSAYTAMKSSGEPLTPPEGITRTVLWVAALLAGAFGALLVIAIFSGRFSNTTYCSPSRRLSVASTSALRSFAGFA